MCAQANVLRGQKDRLFSFIWSVVLLLAHAVSFSLRVWIGETKAKISHSKPCWTYQNHTNCLRAMHTKCLRAKSLLSIDRILIGMMNVLLCLFIKQYDKVFPLKLLLTKKFSLHKSIYIDVLNWQISAGFSSLKGQKVKINNNYSQ